MPKLLYSKEFGGTEGDDFQPMQPQTQQDPQGQQVLSSMQFGGNEQDIEIQPPPAIQEEESFLGGLYEGAKDVFTGESRTDPATAQLPELASSRGITTGEVGKDLKVAAGLMFQANPEAKKDIILENFPQATFSKDQYGVEIIDFGDGNKAVLNKAGASFQDFLGLTGDIAAFYGPSKLAGLGKSAMARIGIGAAGAGATQAGLEKGGQLLGSKQEVDPTSVALATGFGGAGEAAQAALAARSATKQAGKLGVAKEELKEATKAAQYGQKVAEKADIGLFQAQQTQDPYSLAKQSLLSFLSGGSKTSAKALKTQNKQAYQATEDLLNSIAPVTSLETGGYKMRTAANLAIDAKKLARKEAASPLYKEAYADLTPIELPQTLEVIESARGRFPEGGDVNKVLNKIEGLLGQGDGVAEVGIKKTTQDPTTFAKPNIKYNLQTTGTSFDNAGSGSLYGYKVMKVNEEGKLVSGANSRLSFDNKKLSKISMGGDGIFLSNDPDYVVGYYGGLADDEVLLKLKFRKASIKKGVATDRQPEIGVKEAIIMDSIPMKDGEIVGKISKPKQSFDDFLESQPIKAEKLDDSMAHRPTETGATLDDITAKGELTDDTIYSNPEWYSDMSQPYTKESFKQISNFKGQPNKEVTFYRAAAKDEIRNGDWVTLSKKYAQDQAERMGNKVYTFKAKAKDLQFAGDDLNEFGYWGHSTKEKASLKKAYEKGLTPKAGPTIQKLQGAKLEIDDMLSNFGEGSLKNTEKREVAIIKESLLNELDQANPAYQQAREAFRSASPAVNEIEQSIIGRIAGLDEGQLKQTSRIIFDPTETNPTIIKNAKKIIKEQDPEAWDQIIRTELERRLGSVRGEISEAGATSENIPSQIHRAIFGNAKQRKVLYSGLDGESLKNVRWLEEGLKRAGTGRAGGSMTAMNQMIIGNLRGGVTRAAQAVASPLKTMAGVGEETLFNNNVKSMANIMFDPKWKPELKRLRKLSPKSKQAANELKILLKSALQDLKPQTNEGE